MKTHVLRGSKEEIAKYLVKLSGEVREAIVFEEDDACATGPLSDEEDIFEEMQSLMVEVAEVIDSRGAIYARAEGE